MGTGREAELFHGRFEDAHGFGLERAELANLPGVIRPLTRVPWAESLGLAGPGLEDLLRKSAEVGPGGSRQAG